MTGKERKKEREKQYNIAAERKKERKIITEKKRRKVTRKKENEFKKSIGNIKKQKERKKDKR